MQTEVNVDKPAAVVSLLDPQEILQLSCRKYHFFIWELIWQAGKLAGFSSRGDSSSADGAEGHDDESFTFLYPAEFNS